MSAPESLVNELRWFGKIIGRPIDENSRINPISPVGRPMEEEVAEHIRSSPTMRPVDRIQIYNQQYWWRLLNTLHDLFPLVTRLFGYHDFNKVIGIPYLAAHPPSDWSLSLLGGHLPFWIEHNYHESDKKLVYDAACLDEAFSTSFLTKELPPLAAERFKDEAQMEAVLDETLFLQPHLYLFAWDYDLFDYRVNFLVQEPEYWIEHDFPVLKQDRPFYFVLYRNLEKNTAWKEISSAEHFILSRFMKGCSVNQVCELLEEDGELFGYAAAHLQLWFQEWTQRGWLSNQNPHHHRPE